MNSNLQLTILILILTIVIGVIVVSIYGVILAFKASIILGIIALVAQPSPFVFGIVALFGTNVPNIVQAWINFPI